MISHVKDKHFSVHRYCRFNFMPVFLSLKSLFVKFVMGVMNRSVLRNLGYFVSVSNMGIHVG